MQFNVDTHSLRVLSKWLDCDGRSWLIQQHFWNANADTDSLRLLSKLIEAWWSEFPHITIPERSNHDTWIWRWFKKCTHGIHKNNVVIDHLLCIQITTRKSGKLPTNIGMSMPALLSITLPTYRTRSHNDNYWLGTQKRIAIQMLNTKNKLTTQEARHPRTSILTHAHTACIMPRMPFLNTKAVQIYSNATAKRTKTDPVRGPKNGFTSGTKKGTPIEH